MLRVKQFLIMAVLLVCLVAVPVLAQDATSTTAADTSDPISTLVILGGLVAIFAVGGLIYMKENAKSGKEVD